MATKNQKTQPVKKNQAPIDENPLAKPDESKKDLAVKKQQKSRTMKDKEW